MARGPTPDPRIALEILEDMLGREFEPSVLPGGAAGTFQPAPLFAGAYPQALGSHSNY
jgi:hypothetical protein